MLGGLAAALVGIAALIVTNRSLKKDLNFWISELAELAGVYPLVLTDIQVGNSGGESNWLAEPGKRLDAVDMRYFATRISYEVYHRAPGFTLPLTVTIYNPDGQRMTATGRETYTYTQDVSFPEYTGTVDISGWGNKERSVYRRGTWRVEVWHKDVCLGAKAVTIY
jgi:hypothetical protein